MTSFPAISGVIGTTHFRRDGTRGTKESGKKTDLATMQFSGARRLEHPAGAQVPPDRAMELTVETGTRFAAGRVMPLPVRSATRPWR